MTDVLELAVKQCYTTMGQMLVNQVGLFIALSILMIILIIVVISYTRYKTRAQIEIEALRGKLLDLMVSNGKTKRKVQ